MYPVRSQGMPALLEGSKPQLVRIFFFDLTTLSRGPQFACEDQDMLCFMRHAELFPVADKKDKEGGNRRVCKSYSLKAFLPYDDCTIWRRRFCSRKMPFARAGQVHQSFVLQLSSRALHNFKRNPQRFRNGRHGPCSIQEIHNIK